MTETKHRGRWQPGQSGNPRGKKPGAGRLTHLRESIAKDLPEIIETLTRQAKAGDVHAAKLLIEKVLPSVRACEAPVHLALDPSARFSEQARYILHAVATGILAPGQGSQLLSGLAGIARLHEVDELTKRIEQLEVKDEN